MTRFWIKLYLEILEDPKMGRLPNHLWRRGIEFFLLAGKNGDTGALPPVEEMAWALRSSDDEVRKSLMSLAEIGVVHETPEGWVVTHFKDRQYSESYERVKRYRNAKRNEDETEVYLSSSSSDSGFSDSLSEGGGVGEGTNDSRNPETPKQAASHPDIMAYQRICGGFPGERDYAKIIETIQFLRGKYGDKLEETLKPYWLAWSTRRNKDGKPYSPHSLVWLCEWAMQGDVPRANGHEPKRTHNKDIIRKAAQHATR